MESREESYPDDEQEARLSLDTRTRADEDEMSTTSRVIIIQKVKSAEP
jgi:hypothetical protein